MQNKQNEKELINKLDSQINKAKEIQSKRDRVKRNILANVESMKIVKTEKDEKAINREDILKMLKGE
jgi:hypothetical protein